MVVYATEKILKRLKLLVISKKKQSTTDLFTIELCLGIQEWARLYPTFDGKKSPFKVSYDELVAKKIEFPLPSKPRQKVEPSPAPAPKKSIEGQIQDLQPTVEVCRTVQEILVSGQAQNSGEFLLPMVQQIVDGNAKAEKLVEALMSPADASDPTKKEHMLSNLFNFSDNCQGILMKCCQFIDLPPPTVSKDAPQPPPPEKKNPPPPTPPGISEEEKQLEEAKRMSLELDEEERK